MRRLTVMVLATLVLALSGACGSALASAELYQQSVDKMKQQKTFHLDGKIELAVTDESSQGFSLSMGMEGDAVMPDRFRGTMRVAILGQSVAQDVLVVGGRAWSRQSGEIWTEAASSNAIGTTGMFVDAKLLKSIQELELETIDGRRVRHLLVDFDLAALAQNDERVAQAVRELVAEGALDEHSATLKLDHWVDAESGFIRRQRVAMDTSIRGGSVAMTMVFDYSRIGQPVQPPIEAPR
jgi:hypothetical protein